MYLLDTNVVSELRRTRPHGGALAWLTSLREGEAHICAVTAGEIQAGIQRTRKRDPAKAAHIENWLGEVERAYEFLPVDAAAFREWARLMHGKSDDLIEDAMIAAVALTRGLVVATRNVKDFAVFGVKVVDPFAPR